MVPSWIAIGIVSCIAVGLLIWKVWPKTAVPTKREGFQTPTLPEIPADLASQIDTCKVLRSLLTSITNQIEKASSAGASSVSAGQLDLMKTTKASIEQQLAATNCS